MHKGKHLDVSVEYEQMNKNNGLNQKIWKWREDIEVTQKIKEEKATLNKA